MIDDLSSGAKRLMKKQQQDERDDERWARMSFSRFGGLENSPGRAA
jgi:hypothetical protein